MCISVMQIWVAFFNFLCLMCFCYFNLIAIVFCVVFLECATNRTFFMPPKELWEAYSNRTVRPSVPLRVRCIFPIFFDVELPNLVCGCILGWRSVAYHFRVNVTLTSTSDLIFIVIALSICLSIPLRVRCISPILFEVGFPNLMCGCILDWRSVTYYFWVTVTLTLTSDLVLRIIVSGAYLLNYLR